MSLSLTRTLALGGLGLAAGLSPAPPRERFDPYNVLPFVSLASLVSTIALVRFSGPESFEELCKNNEFDPICQTFSVFENAIGTSDHQLTWNNQFAVEATKPEDGIQASDMTSNVMWGKDSFGHPFIVIKYDYRPLDLSRKAISCVATFFQSKLDDSGKMAAVVTPANCRLGPLDPSSVENQKLFDQDLSNFFNGFRLKAEDGLLTLSNSIIFSDALKDLKKPTPIFSDALKDLKKPTPEPAGSPDPKADITDPAAASIDSDNSTSKSKDNSKQSNMNAEADPT